MTALLEPMLYIDPQTQPRWDLCPDCGAVRYWPGYVCIRCERRLP